jgi:hypothetical protein
MNAARSHHMGEPWARTRSFAWFRLLTRPRLGNASGYGCPTGGYVQEPCGLKSVASKLLLAIVLVLSTRGTVRAHVSVTLLSSAGDTFVGGAGGNKPNLRHRVPLMCRCSEWRDDRARARFVNPPRRVLTQSTLSS